MSLYATLAGIVSLIAALAGAALWGGRSANARRNARDARRAVETYRSATEARDAVDDLSDPDVLDRLRKRSRK